MISVGVDLGTYSIKLAEVEATSKSYIIHRVMEIPLSLDPNKDRKIQIIDALRTTFGNYDLSKTSFVFSLPQKSISNRLIQLPFRERFKVQKASIALLEDEIPFSLEDAIFDAKIVRYQGKGADVLAMATPRERVNELVQLAHDCGVDPILISCDGVGLTNLFEKWWDPPSEALPALQEVPTAKVADIVLNLGHTTTDLLVMAEGSLLSVRNVDWGAKNLAEAIGHRYGLNYLQAMKELQSKGFVLLEKTPASREQQAFSQVIEGSLELLVHDLRLKLLELQSELGLQWGKGWLTGGAAALKNLNGYLTQGLQIPFNRYKQFDHHPSVNFNVDGHTDLVTSVAVGLAIEGIKRPRNPASNFLKGDLAKQSNFLESVKEKWGYAASVGATLFFIFFVYAVIRDSLALSLLDQSQLALKKQAEAVAGLKGSRANERGIRNFISKQEKIARGRKQAENVLKLNSALDVLRLISSSVPSRDQGDLEIKYLTIRGTAVEVHGYAGNGLIKNNVVKGLTGMASGGKLHDIPNRVTAIPAGQVPFSYKMTTSRSGGG
ncbi:MAG: pilus assembly protein PilM [Bdellovibrionales bacterium]